MKNTEQHEHAYHDASHFNAELLGKPGTFSVRITASDQVTKKPEYTGRYVPIHLKGPFKDVNEAQCALETFFIGVRDGNKRDPVKEYTYYCDWCEDSRPIKRVRRLL